MTTEATAKDSSDGQKTQDGGIFGNYNLEPEKSRVAPGLYKPQPEETILEWQAASRVFKKRNRQFFSTVIIIALLICLIFFFAGQFLPIAVVISVVFLVYVLSVVPPHEMTYKVTTYGVRLDKEIYYWEEMGRYWFENKHDQKVLNIEIFRFPGRLTLVLGGKTEQQMEVIFSEVLLKEKPELTQFEKLAEWLQEKIPLD